MSKSRMYIRNIAIVAMLSITMAYILTSCGTSNSSADSSEGEYSRIVVTSTATCEILDKLEVEGVVGVPETESYTIPERYSGATKVGGAMSPDMEIIASLKPDIILSPNSLESTLKEKYDNIGVDSYFLELKSVDGMYESIKTLGDMLGKEEQAAKLIAEYESQMASIEENTKNKKKPKVLILMGLPGSYVVATENSYVGNLVKLAGGENVYGDGDGKDFLNINPEDMLLQKPDIILRTSHAMPEQVMEMFKTEFEENDTWKHFDAVKNGEVYDLDNQYFGMSATFKYMEALDKLQEILY